jgi:hypothetical protein
MRPLIAPMLLLAVAAPLAGEVALLVGEPYGKFGFFNPTGHAAVYLSRVCAASPTHVRLCEPGELGVVISRYNRIDGRDWIAVPVLPYFYAVEHPDQVPDEAGAPLVARLRDRYRRAHLRQVAPDGPGGEVPPGDWIQLVGSAYDRSIHGFMLPTSPEDDERLVEWLNARPNRRRFHLLYRNCADFARRIVNFYYPKAVRRNIIADMGITTPKHAAKALVSHSRKRDLPLAQFTVPQVPGSPRSTALRGVSESLVRSKKYVVPLVILQPWVAGSAAAAYLFAGRFNPAAQPSAVCDPAAFPSCLGTPESARVTPADVVESQ